jgi:hypothetical protein
MTQSPTYETQFGSLSSFQKGRIDIVNDDPRHYAFSNIFDVASRSAPYEKVAVGKNMEYVLEAIRADGVSPWRTSGHDEFVLVMDGEVEISLVKLDSSPLNGDSAGSVSLDGEPEGRRMGRVVARRGHMTLLPAGAAYRFTAPQPAVMLQQTITSPDTKFRWTEIIQSL